MNDEYRPERPWVRAFMIAFAVSAALLLLGVILNVAQGLRAATG